MIRIYSIVVATEPVQRTPIAPLAWHPAARSYLWTNGASLTSCDCINSAISVYWGVFLKVFILYVICGRETKRQSLMKITCVT